MSINQIIENEQFKLFWKILEVAVLGIAIWLIGSVNAMQQDIAVLKVNQMQNIKLEERLNLLDKQIKLQNDLLIELKIKLEMKNERNN